MELTPAGGRVKYGVRIVEFESKVTTTTNNVRSRDLGGLNEGEGELSFSFTRLFTGRSHLLLKIRAKSLVEETRVEELQSVSRQELVIH